MLSVVSLCNLALSRLGDAASIAAIHPPEGSPQAEHCAMFYPITRDSLLESHPWKFATRRKTLAKLDTDPSPWAFAYAPPNDMLRALSIQSPTQREYDKNDYAIRLDDNLRLVLYTDIEGAILQYIARVEDVSLYPPLFSDALSWALAANIAGSLLKGEAGANRSKACLQQMNLILAQAKTSDANQEGLSSLKHTPSWIEQRG